MNSTLYVLALLFNLIHSAFTIETNPEGKWVYGWNELWSIDMKTGENTIIDQLQGYNITQVSKIDEHRILVTANGPRTAPVLNQREMRNRVFVYDMQRKNFTYLLEGNYAEYIPKLNKIVFISNGIKIADIDGAPESIETLLPNGAYSDWGWTLFDDESILVSLPNYKNPTKPTLYLKSKVLYIPKKSIEDTNAFISCHPYSAVWRSRTKQLLCKEYLRDDFPVFPYFLSDSDGSNRQRLPAKFNDYYIFGYAEPIDSFIYADCRLKLFGLLGLINLALSLELIDRMETCWLYAGNFEDFSTKRITKDSKFNLDYRSSHYFNGAYFK